MVDCSEAPHLSRVIFTINDAVCDVEQATKELCRVIEVVKIAHDQFVTCELSLINVATAKENRGGTHVVDRPRLTVLS